MFRKCSENVRKILSGEKYKYSKRVTQLFITLLERSSGQNFPEYFFRKIWKFIILFFGTSIKFNNFVENYKRRVA